MDSRRYERAIHESKIPLILPPIRESLISPSKDSRYTLSCDFYDLLACNPERTSQPLLVTVQVVRESDYAEVIEPGQYDVYAGGGQPGDSKAPANVLMGSFSVTGDETPLSQCSS